MTRMLVRLVFALAVITLLYPAVARAQGGSSASSLSGVVVDADGGVIPGATVVVKNNATGATYNAVTNTTGGFTIPAVDIGTYTVTVSLTGFKTVVISDVRLVAGTPASVKATLAVGSLSETVEVRGGSPLVQTQSATVSSTLSVEQISNLPLVTRNALNFLTFLPGVDTATGPRNATINGLPQNTINVLVDGVNVNNNLQSGDGFYTMIRPQLDAVEEVTVTGAAPGADGGGNGAVQVKFVTRSGSNQLSGSIYHYFRHPSLNTNYYFNEVNGLDRNRVILHQFGGRVGGPIRIPGVVDGRNKAFFFFNLEEFRQPTEQSRTRVIANPSAQEGLFRYTTASGVREANLLALAAERGFTSTIDPDISALLAKIRTQAGTTGTISDTANNPNTQQYFFQAAGTGVEHLPTTRLDFNLSTNHRLSATYYWQQIKRDPDILNGQEQRFPGFATRGAFDSYRTTGSTRLRSTLSSTMVNELTFGWQWSPLDFATNAVPSDFADQAGFSLTLGFGLTDPTAASSNGPSSRNTTNWNIDNSLNWQRGNHSVNMGFSFTQLSHVETAYNNVPTITFGVDQTNDPANAMFTSTVLPGASTTNLADARALYALLTGRVTQIGGTARIAESGSEYVYLGPRTQRARLNEFGLFVQDSWRLSPTLTLSGGVRWEVQLPFTPLNGAYATTTVADLCGVSGLGNGPGGRACNIFNPNASGGVRPQFTQFTEGSTVYGTDWNNLAPNVGVAWRPNVQGGFLRHILGDPEQATLRAGYSVSFTRNRMDEFTGVYAANPGSTFNANRSAATGSLVLPGETWPVLFREKNRLGAPAIPEGPSYPLASSVLNSINLIDPESPLGSVRSYTVGFQRSISSDTAIEVRYVGNQSVNDWIEENWNEITVVENGFLNEFRLAQANLQAHVAAGCGTANAAACSFAYRGPGTGTSPLPIYLAHFNAATAAQATDPSRYGGTNWTNSTRLGELSLFNPQPANAATALGGSGTAAQAFRTNALSAGLSPNFFVMNPDASSANITRAVGGSRYHAMQVEVRRRLSKGLYANGSYAYSLRNALVLDTLSRDRRYELSTGNNDGIRHAIKMTSSYELPVGRGHRFGSDLNPWLNGIVGNWMVNLAGRVQWRELSLSNVRLVGMTPRELGAEYGFRIEKSPETGTTTVYTLPQDIIDNTIRAFSTDPTSTTGFGALGAPTGRYIAPASSPNCIRVYTGDCGEANRIYVMTPAFARFDLSVKKRFPLVGRANVEFEFDLLNVFDNINFTPVLAASSSATLNQTTSAYQDTANTFDPGGRLGQIIWRVNW